MEELYISDLDGTLLNSEGKLSSFSLQQLNHLIREGLNFTIATARSWDSALPIIKGLDLQLPVVLYNGVLLYDPILKENVAQNFIPKSDVEILFELCQLYQIEPIVFTLDASNKPSAFYRHISNPHMATYINTRIAQKDKRFKEVKDFTKAKQENTITLITIGEFDPLARLKNEVEKQTSLEIHFAEDVYYKGAYWLEFTALNSTKASGVQFLKQTLKSEKTIVFGDNLNDIPMFELADETYATANAREELKQLATGIIGHCDDDAVVKFITSRI